MSLARAPGKIVVSGAYAVLDGAPAIVSAVDRYVTADTSRPAVFRTPEVAAALGDRPAPWFDSSPLRDGDRKLGLGSSAAILVASLAAVALDHGGAGKRPTAAELCAAVLDEAVRAHARAQGGGSGIDVAASAHGGTIVARRRAPAAPLDVRRCELPPGLLVEVWASGRSASTPDLVAKVRRLGRNDPSRYGSLMSKLRRAAEGAAEALRAGRVSPLLGALAEQARWLAELGDAAGVPIVTPGLRGLSDAALREGCVFMPSGAGGGDVSILASDHPASTGLAGLAIEQGLRRLDVRLGARGVHELEETRSSS